MAEKVAVEGCQHCGVTKRDHPQLWQPGIGWHGWAPPSGDQIRARMRSNRGMDGADEQRDELLRQVVAERFGTAGAERP